MNKLEQFFEKNKILLLDGATGTELFKKGLKAGECPELWNITHQEDIKAIAASYFNAGSDAVLTNTFGGSPLKLNGYGLQDRVHELNFVGVKNALDVRPAGKFVFAEIGPCGAMPEPFGDTPLEKIIAAFAEQAKALADSGPDAFTLETFSDINEVDCAIKAIKQHSDLPIIVSLTFNKTPMGYHTMMGTSIEEAVSFLLSCGVYAIGSNCGNGIDNMIEVGKLIRAQSPVIKIMVKPNAGEPLIKDGALSYNEAPSMFMQKAEDLLSFSPSFLGGCCGTTPEHINVLRKIINTFAIE
jgi:5-methyltetrahydrofolate--homocysteine methyltransferase